MSIRQPLLTVALACLLLLAALPACSAAVPSGCIPIYAGADGWAIEQCAADPNVPATMTVRLDGVAKGKAALLRIAHQAQAGPGVPQVALIYASAYVRLKQNADPAPAIPFGGSFVLGPAYWPAATTYHHNPRLDQIAIDTAWLPYGPLRMQATGTNQDFAVAYQLDLPPPTDRQTRMHITQTYTATADVVIDPGRRAERQGFKLAQVSSMFANQGGSCVGGQTDCHDSNAARFIGADLARRAVAFGALTLPGFVFADPPPLGETWLDTLHTDDAGWQGNTPNLRLALDELPTDRTITPQGYIAATNNPNDDNVGMWLHDDGVASAAWQAGQSGQIGYWLLAQDNPPDPIGDLGLRPGPTFLDFERGASCFPVAAPTVAVAVTTIAGATGTAAQLTYNLGSAQDNWAQIRCNFDPPLNLATFDHLRIEWRGAPAAANSIQIGLVNPAAGGERIFARGYHHVAQHSWWGRMVVPFAFLEPWTAGAGFDPAQVSALFVSVVKDADDLGGAGSIAIDNLGAFNAAARRVPPDFEPPPVSRRASIAAASWLAAQQRPNGLLKSWDGDTRCLAYTYDQALALVVFARERMWANADALAGALVALQNPDGSWYQTRDCDTLEAVGSPPNKWEGDIAWAVLALSQYVRLRGPPPAISAARDRAADWLAAQINPTDGCLMIDHTEATIDAWWAFQSAGRPSAATQIKNCLLTFYWDSSIGRFKGGRNWLQPYLDNQTWGAAFLKAIGEQEQARRALSYAQAALLVPARGGQLFGFDGHGGPWSVWNDGAGQYIAAGGPGTADLLRELLAQQRADGALPSSPDAWNGGGAWTTRWGGVAPTAWLYNAMNCGPLDLGSLRLCFAAYLPITSRSGNSTT
jgi:hypothetical protein